MSPYAPGVSIFSDDVPQADQGAVEADAGTYLPAAFSGLRKIVRALEAVAPQARARWSASHPSEWNRLFPGAVNDAPDLSDLALTPSERRLHRESEQTFRVLNVAAGFIVDALRACERPLVIRNSGEADLVSLRGVMRAVEWARWQGVPAQIHFAQWNRRRHLCSASFQTRRAELLQSLARRMRVAPPSFGRIELVRREVEAPEDLEGTYLASVVDEQRSPGVRLAAAVLAIRAAFFSTNYEGAMLAAETGLALLDALGGKVNEAEVAAAWDGLDTGLVSPAIEVDKSSLGDAEALRALFHRSSGVVHAFVGEFDEALADFARGLECRISPERQGQLRMYRALTLIKRLGNVDKARAEIQAGLEGMKDCSGEDRLLHEGWLRNVMALTYFQEKKLEPAVNEEKLAIKCVGELRNPSATHLKINLISNLSVVQETARRYEDAITTWRRFEKISENWGENFHKHHRYRLAGLTLAAGRPDEAVGWYKGAYENADKLGDVYHRQLIAAELGRHYLDGGDTTASVEWFGRAVDYARQVGCPFRGAESLAGLALARGGTDFSEAIAAAEASSTFPDEAKALADTLRSGDAAAVQAKLPRPRSKLNRPFDLVNLY